MMTEETRPSRPPKRKRRKTSGLGCMVSVLAAIVGINLCLTFGFIDYYISYRNDALAANQTPAPPLEVLRTVVPILDSTPAPTPVPTATTQPATGVVNILLM